MKHRIFLSICTVAAVLAVVCFRPFASRALTLTTISQNPEKTMEKYKDYWDDTTIKSEPMQKKEYKIGQVAATITIPKLGYYELPIYYGSDIAISNWQITTLGYSGGWNMFGEKGCAAVGAHNYQLFGKLPTLLPGDKFIIETDRDIYVYESVGSHIYDHTKENWGDVAYGDSDEYSVALMTCYPIEAMDTQDMYIVYSKLTRGTIFQ